MGTALSELPPAVRPLVRAYVDNVRDGAEIRSQLSSALTAPGLRWYQVDNLAREPLAQSDSAVHGPQGSAGVASDYCSRRRGDAEIRYSPLA